MNPESKLSVGALPAGESEIGGELKSSVKFPGVVSFMNLKVTLTFIVFCGMLLTEVVPLIW